MKTIEEKARAYDEVLNKLRHFIAKGVDPLITRADVQDFFPELAESEGEKIKKRITLCLEECVHSDVIRDYEKDECISWLEKQGTPAKLSEEEQNRFAKGVLTSCALSFIDYLDAHKYEGKMCVSNGECEDIENAFHNAMWDRLHRYYCKYIEKQGEQKPVDKVEPKFKVGDKIYLKPEYRMPNDDTPIANTVKEIRRIDDKHYRFDGSYIFIEDQDKYELVEPKTEENKGNIGGISPNWSEEDESILQGIWDEILANKHDAKECEWKTYDMFLNWLKSLQGRVQPQPKQEWSEEDEQHIDSLLKRLDALCRNKFERTRFAISEDRDWLKSLKDRVGCEANCTTTKEWSEDDKRKIYRIYSILRQAADTHAFSTSCRLIGDKECMELQDWLKSLRHQNRCAYNPYKAVVESIAEMCKHYDKASHSGLRDFYDNVKVKCKEAKEYDSLYPQNHWKPSDEQMGCLSDAIEHYNSLGYPAPKLKELLDDLKKLREGKV